MNNAKSPPNIPKNKVLNVIPIICNPIFRPLVYKAGNVMSGCCSIISSKPLAIAIAAYAIAPKVLKIIVEITILSKFTPINKLKASISSDCSGLKP